MENTEKLQLLNQFTRRELTEEEVYIFEKNFYRRKLCMP